MFLGAGLGAYGAAIFLLVAHAFFKALLFLSAGSVIHGLHDEQDMMKMGGLRRAMPFTAGVWLIGWAAMVGIPPLSGFFAKDQIVAAASQAGRTGLYVAALVGALLTAVYASRQTALVFFGERRYLGEPHEPGWVMRFPMLLLALGAAGAGLLGLAASSGILVTFLEPVVGAVPEPVAGPSEAVLTLVSVVVAVAGIALAWFVWLSRRIDWVALRVRYAGLRSTLRYGFHVDGFYDAVLGRTSALAATFMAYVVDRRILDGFWNGLAGFFGALSTGARRAQVGLVRVYAAFVFLGVVGMLAYLAVRWSG
jgi:NADH-quinone oxidoreductase subunit L